MTVYSDGMTNMIKAMDFHGVRRLVCVSSIGVTPEHAPGESFTFRKVTRPCS